MPTGRPEAAGRLQAGFQTGKRCRQQLPRRLCGQRNPEPTEHGWGQFSLAGKTRRRQETPDCDSQVNRLWFRGSTVRTPKPAYHLLTCCSLEGGFPSRQRNTKPGFKRQNSCTSDPLSQTRKAFSGTSVRQDWHCPLPGPPVRSVTGLLDPGGGDHPPCSLNRLVSPGESHPCEFHRRVGSPVNRDSGENFASQPLTPTVRLRPKSRRAEEITVMSHCGCFSGSLSHASTLGSGENLTDTGAPVKLVFQRRLD